MNKFEIISKYKDADLTLPIRSTTNSAGYDLAAAEDIVIPTVNDLWETLLKESLNKGIALKEPISLSRLSALTKETKAKPTLVPTGMKCYLDSDKYLELSVRSSTPYKYWLFLANGVGIVDADYVDNPDNEGHIFLQLLNLSPLPILIKKGEKIGQGIIKQYLTTDEDNVSDKVRSGGLGSTTAQ